MPNSVIRISPVVSFNAIFQLYQICHYIAKLFRLFLNEILFIQHSARDCTWDAWSEWTQCSTTCGSGSRERTREKLVVEVGGGTCSGKPRESEACKLDDCSGKTFYK